MSDHVTVEGVEFVKVLPSGKAFIVKHEGRDIIVPMFAVSDNSEIWNSSLEGETGKLVIMEKIAADKGLIDPPSRSLGGGIPLKRNRLPDPPKPLPGKRLEAIQARWEASSAHELGWAADEGMVRLGSGNDRIIALFEGVSDEEDALFAAHAPTDINDLLNENAQLRAWVELATKRFNAKRRKT